VRNTRPLFWIFVPILLALSIGAAWGTVHFGPIGKPSQAAVECSNLQKFVANEELEGKAEWVEYRSLVDQFLALSPTSDARIPLIEEMASKVIGVLGHDLVIYKEMEKFTGCLLQSKRSEIPGLIEETESAIAFLNGSTPLNGNFFDPELGTWNTAYYEEYLSAQDFLKDSRRNAV
jgi:hypothetical protein